MACRLYTIKHQLDGLYSSLAMFLFQVALSQWAILSIILESSLAVSTISLLCKNSAALQHELVQPSPEPQSSLGACSEAAQSLKLRKGDFLQFS